jgi:hypothetical protein
MGDDKGYDKGYGKRLGKRDAEELDAAGRIRCGQDFVIRGADEHHRIAHDQPQPYGEEDLVLGKGVQDPVDEQFLQKTAVQEH